MDAGEVSGYVYINIKRETTTKKRLQIEWVKAKSMIRETHTWCLKNTG